MYETKNQKKWNINIKTPPLNIENTSSDTTIYTKYTNLRWYLSNPKLVVLIHPSCNIS